MKKTNKNNKGFSLVELIVVIAIMAILVGVIGPQLLKQIEKSRVSKDKTRTDDIFTAVKTALADEELNQGADELLGADGFCTYAEIVTEAGVTPAATATEDEKAKNAFAKDVVDTVGDWEQYDSNDFEESTTADIRVTISDDNKITITVFEHGSTTDDVYTIN